MTNSKFQYALVTFHSCGGSGPSKQTVVDCYGKNPIKILSHSHQRTSLPTLCTLAAQNTPPHATKLHPSKVRTAYQQKLGFLLEMLRRLLAGSKEETKETRDKSKKGLTSGHLDKRQRKTHIMK